MARPKLLFFQADYRDSLPEFMLLHTREHVACLRQSFDVIVINEDCDFGSACDRVEPDLVIFETGPNIITDGCYRPRIRGVRANPQVPRVGFINADAWCETRAGTLAELEYWQADVVFSICTTALEHTPALAQWPLFVWPNFIDPIIFRDYGQPKDIPVFLTGATSTQYPWRRAVYPLVAQAYRTEVAQHPGYLNRSAGLSLFGEAYARTLNRAWFVPTCGTVANELVRKHLEIPGARACLVTQRTPALEAAGFLDMQNCVFADTHDVLDKVRYLFEHPDEQLRLINAGHALVHQRHTIAHRNQVAQWFRLWRERAVGQRVIQAGPFDDLSLSTAPEPISGCVAGRGRHLELLAHGDSHLWAGEYTKAQQSYQNTVGYLRALPEAHFRLALCEMGLGNARAAVEQLFSLLYYSLKHYRSPNPDPVELAYYLVALVCNGQLAKASRCAGDFPWLTHPDLSYARCLVRWATGTQIHCGLMGTAPMASIHTLPERRVREWLDVISSWLCACGQQQVAIRVRAAYERDVLAARSWKYGSFRRRILAHWFAQRAAKHIPMKLLRGWRGSNESTWF